MNVAIAAEMGFERAETERALAIMETANRLDDFDVAMDLARYQALSLDEAAIRMVLRPDPNLRAEVAGQAKAYAGTYAGSLDVVRAKYWLSVSK